MSEHERAAYYAYMERASLGYADAPAAVSTDSDPESALLDADVLRPTPWSSPEASGGASYATYQQQVASGEDARELASLLAGDETGDDDDDDGNKANCKPGRRPKQSVLQRRRRNRESMRRSRMKEKELLTTLRTTLAQLEHKYEALTRYEGHSQSSGDTREAALFKVLQTKLSHAILIKRELEAERAVVQRLLHEREESARELNKVFAEFQIEDEHAAVAERLALLEDQARKYMPEESRPGAAAPPHVSFEFGFEPFSLMQLDALLAGFLSELVRVKEIARANAAQQPPRPEQQSLFLEVLGWQTHRHIDENNQMHFEFSKAFFHLSTQEVVDRAWADAIDLEQYKKAPANGKKPTRNVRRMEFVQRVSDRMGIVVREIKHPEENTIFRTHYALFMLETPEGFVFGIQSINPSAEEQQQFQEIAEQQAAAAAAAADGDGDGSDAAPEKVVWVDVSISIELLRRPRRFLDPLSSGDVFRQDYCEVRWRGKTNYKTPKHAAENAVGFLMGILRWEVDVVGPVFTLTAS